MTEGRLENQKWDGISNLEDTRCNLESITITDMCSRDGFHHGILVCMSGLNSAPECYAGSARVRNRTATHGGAQRRAGMDAAHHAVRNDLRVEHERVLMNCSSAYSLNLFCMTERGVVSLWRAGAPPSGPRQLLSSGQCSARNARRSAHPPFKHLTAPPATLKYLTASLSLSTE
jgi:hypothetical protein